MYHFNVKLFLYKFFTLCFFAMCHMCSMDVSATVVDASISVDDYSYTKVYEKLPAKFQDDEYIYKNTNDICLIEFAEYNGNPYRTSVKKTKGKNNFLYCIDYNNTIDFTDNYRVNDNIFNQELHTRLGMAFSYGPSVWGEKAASAFTTGNSIVDYYMTQLVVHALIYDFAEEKSNMGINFEKITFKDNTGNLKKKTSLFYDFCRNSKILYPDGFFQAVDFSFAPLQDYNMYLDGNSFISPLITCNTDDNNADVTSFTRTINGAFPKLNNVQCKANSSYYNSSFQLSVPIDVMNNISPGHYVIDVSEDVSFARKRAVLWYCAEIGYENLSQELGDVTEVEFEAQDELILDILIGKIYLYKRDSITHEPIEDAKFQILSYNANTNQYEYYCDMRFNNKKSMYESDNLYLSTNNMSGKFKVIEASPGNNYKLDWDGHYFEITPDCYTHEILVENEPILGKLTVTKKGEEWTYNDKELLKNQYVPLPNVKFELYAKDEISIDDIVFKKDQKIVDFYTDKDGVAIINDLPMGNYYIKEIATLDDYVLDQRITEFSITRDENRQYNHVSLSLVNRLKTSQIHIFKCYYDDKDTNEEHPIPLKGAKFGLYLKNDLCDLDGNVIIEKDYCLTTGITDDNGTLVFEHLPYVEYYIKELEAPEDFILNDGIVSLDLDDFVYDESSNSYITQQEIVNKLQRFQLSVEKTGEAFVGFNTNQSLYGDYFNYTIGNTHLKDVTFQLFDSEKHLVATQITDMDGIACFDNLIPGVYYLCEISAPERYKMVDVTKNITLKMNSNEYNEFAPPIVNASFFNELCQCNIRLKKHGERAYVENSNLQYEHIPMKNVVFGIYQNFDYAFADTPTIVKKGSCVGYIVTDEDGNGIYNGKLPCGNYYVKEIHTQENYDTNSKAYYFELKPNHNQNIDVVINDGEPIINELSKASVSIIKTDANTGKSLKGVEFTLYNANKEQIGVYKTNKKGKILVENLPYGKYYFIETKSKNGYYSSNNKYYFELNNEDTIILNITNSPILKLGIDEGYKKALIFTSVFSIFFFLVVFISLYIARKQEGHE